MKSEPIKPDGEARPEESTSQIAPELPSSEAAMRHYTLIAKQPYFKGLNSRQLKLLASAVVETEIIAGQSIFDEGDIANRFYIILEGQVLIEAEGSERERIPIQTLGPTDDLGWSWLFPPYHTHFGARTLTPVKMLLFYAPKLRQQCEKDHQLGYELMKRVAAVMLERLQAVRRRLSEEVAAKRLSLES